MSTLLVIPVIWDSENTMESETWVVCKGRGGRERGGRRLLPVINICLYGARKERQEQPSFPHA